MKETLLGCEVKAEERRRSETVITALTYTPIPDNPPANPEKTSTDKPDDEKTDSEKPHEPEPDHDQPTNQREVPVEN
ncbi:hypothetical protein Pmani_001290 [Petrolisthes manimaculis]|uniref:Uncharacterized protein n=1 Tax=Petrolisthes manimaculis TaxID=1843537 RepID=A0AAE1ULI6_9EUCA|nr:hypothetical protein Pmani_001290 [Petrolisthes manimaculis]